MKWDLEIASLWRRHRSISLKMEKQVRMEERKKWQGRPMGKEVSILCQRGPLAFLAFKFLIPLDLGRVCPSQKAGGDFFMDLFYFLLGLQSLILFTAKRHGHLLTLTKEGNLI